MSSWPSDGLKPNRWDFVLIPLLLLLLAVLAHGGAMMTRPFDIGQPPVISLDPVHLPDYLLNSFMRMFTALRLSLVFSVVYAVLAAKVPIMERFLISLLDILQSVPVLGYLTITIPVFVWLFPHSLLALESAAVFAVFTSQAWNMTFSLYSALKTVPRDLVEVAQTLHLTSWQRFWRLEMPWAIPGLVWNMMMSVSGGWFFVVAAEAISVSGQTVLLPGIGSYIALAVSAGDMRAIGWAIAAVFVGIILYDQIMFRPLVAWAEKFRSEAVAREHVPESWLLDLIQRARFFNGASRMLGALLRRLGDLRLAGPRRSFSGKIRFGQGWRLSQTASRWLGTALAAASALVVVGALLMLTEQIAVKEVFQVVLLGGVTAGRVMASVVLASLLWVPVGVWLGLNPRLAQQTQWVAQFLSAFPANLLFPLFVMVIIRLQLNPEIWTTPLMVMGGQWYILFNVVAGASAIPHDLRDAAATTGLKGWLKWRRFLMPAIFSHLVTGLITAAGGCWNVAIISEWISWGGHRLPVTGLGAYISGATEAGDFPRVALGVLVMCLFVTAFNHLLWRRLFKMAKRFADRAITT